MSMRIIAGDYKGRRLSFSKNPDIRPTMDRVRESLFNIIGPRVEGAQVLDLFAGFGGLGLEALSRGASQTVFVDNNESALKALRENIQTLAIPNSQFSVYQLGWEEALRRLKQLKKSFNLVFIDPPYNIPDITQNALMGLACSGIVRPSSWVVSEYFKKDELAGSALEAVEKSYSVLETRKYGQTFVSILEKK